MRSIVLLLLCSILVDAEEDVDTKITKSPDGKRKVEVRTHYRDDFPRIEVVLSEGAKKLSETTIPPEKEARYIKVWWAPKSDTVLVGINCKAWEEWTLIRLTNGAASSTHFSSDPVDEKLLKTLPFREDLKSSAPVAQVPRKLVRWLKDNQCEMKYIFHGIGYEGMATLLIDFQNEPPMLKIQSIVPKVDEALWDQD